MSRLSDAEARFLMTAAGVSVPLTAGSADALCASKQAQHDFFPARGFAVPHDFPDGSEPYIVRPDRAEGGRGIWVTDDYCEVGGAVNANFVTQEQLTGDVYSVQLLGTDGRYAALPAAKLIINGFYDRCEAQLDPAFDPDGALHALSLGVADAMALEGAAELKTVLHGGKFYCLALNAGFAPLTAAALYFAGLNAAEAYAALKAGAPLPEAEEAASVRLEKDGRPVGSRDADGVGTLTETPDGLTDGSILLRKI